jgi:hypothetical protein
MRHPEQLAQTADTSSQQLIGLKRACGGALLGTDPILLARPTLESAS